MSDDLSKRIDAFVRNVAVGGFSLGAITTEARAIVALLTEAVDPDLVEARRVVCESVPSWNDDHRRACMQGEYDSNLFVIIARRALERDSREG